MKFNGFIDRGADRQIDLVSSLTDEIRDMKIVCICLQSTDRINKLKGSREIGSWQATHRTADGMENKRNSCLACINSRKRMGGMRKGERGEVK
jgi:hypothetical protein